MHKQLLLTLVCLAFCINALAQGTIRGDFMLNAYAYENDPRLGQFGTNTPQYQQQLSAAESWLFLGYSINNLEFNFRYDLFHNSALLNPNEAYTEQGLPFFSASWKSEKLEATVGSFYDQFGTGVLFRAYEDRVIGLDFAMQGVKLKYSFNDRLSLKGFTGKQKFRFDQKPAVVKGLNLEGTVGDTSWVWNYGLAYVNRTLDTELDMQPLADLINSYALEDRFVPKFNVHSFQHYGTLSKGKVSLFYDAAYKTEEAVFDYTQTLQNRDGYYLNGGVNYSTKGFGLSMQVKRADYFVVRTNPFTALNPIIEGTVSFLPPVNRQNSFRLPARYSPAVQEIGELGFQADVTISPNKKSTFYLNFSHIEQPNELNTLLYEEWYFEYLRKWSRKFKTIIGAQNLFYNIEIYQGKAAGTPHVKSISPFLETVYKFDRRRSLRMELQFLRTDQDLGDFAFALLEFNIAPKYSISVSDMINTAPVPENRNPEVAEGEIVHYPTVFLAYTMKQTRFTMGYIKQVEGVVCTGGICRVEPAFSGVRFGLTTNF